MTAQVSGEGQNVTRPQNRYPSTDCQKFGMVDYVRETTPCQISFKCLHEGWGLTLRYILDYDKDDNGDTDEDNCACAVVEKVLRHYMCHHPRRYTRSNHWSCHRVVIATVSAPAVLLRCCRHEGGTAIC